MKIKHVILVIIFISVKVYAGDKPVQIALFTPLQIFPEENSITGIRWNVLYGKNISVTGLDFGLVNRTTEKMSYGVQFGILAFADRGWTGWQSVNDIFIILLDKKNNPTKILAPSTKHQAPSTK
jgi:hypothetical protein